MVMKSSVFWDITPCSPLKVNRSFGWTYRKQSLLFASLWFLSSTLKMEATCSSETSFYFRRTTRPYSPEYKTLGIGLFVGRIKIRVMSEWMRRGKENNMVLKGVVCEGRLGQIMAEWLNRRQRESCEGDGGRSEQVNGIRYRKPGTGSTSLFLPPAAPSESDPIRVSSLLPIHCVIKERPFNR
jgi:hypothetical protein